MELERSLIGRFLNDNDAIAEAGLSAKHFTDPLAREAYRAIEAVISDGGEANLVTVSDKSQVLSKRAHELAGMTSDALHGPVAYAVKKIKDGYMRKQLAELSEELPQMAPEDALRLIDERVADMVADADEDRIWASRELVPSMLKEIEDRYHGRADTGLSTGFPAIDAIIGGFRDRQYYIFGARPSDGKSAILLNMARHASAKHPTGFITAESSKEETMMRALSDVASIDSRRIQTGVLSQGDFVRLHDGAQRLHDAQLYFYDRPNVELQRLVTMAKMMHRRFGIKALFIDYIQNITAPNSSDPRHLQVATISKRLKQLAREMQIPVIAAAQLTRDAQGRRPNLADFGESGQLEKDADVACLLHHEYDPDTGMRKRVWGHFDKVRHGATGSVKLQFIGKYVRFAEESNAYQDMEE